jgi:DNA invertase Pin-like site-specific DNA recombinase
VPWALNPGGIVIVDIYTRVSDEGSREGPSFGSPEEQEAAARAWCGRENVEVGEVVYEGNVSGGLAAEERQLGRLIERVEDGESGGIVVRYEDRFARDVVKGGQALKRIVDAGGRLVATATGFDSANLNSQSQMMFNIMMAIGQAQRERSRESYMRGKERAVARGVYAAVAPFGYDKDAAGRLVPNADADGVRTIFRLRAEGVGFSEIAARVGKVTSRSGVRRIVMNRAYLGEQRIPNPEKRGDPKVIPNSHKPLVTEAEWQAANAVRNPAPVRRGLSGRTQLKGIVRCGSCERTMHVLSYGKNREKITYACTKCGKASMAVAKVEPAVLDLLKRAILTAEPHVSAVIEGDTRYTDALAAVEAAQLALAQYRDNIELQQTLGMSGFAAGLKVRKQAVETAQRALREAPRPAPLSREKMTLEEFDLVDRRQFYSRCIAEVRVFPLTSGTRLTLRWHGSEEHIEVPAFAPADLTKLAAQLERPSTKERKQSSAVQTSGR